MNIFVCIFGVTIVLGGMADAVYTNRSLEGYYAGQLADCPGSMKPSIISEKNLKYLEIFVSGSKVQFGRRIKYTYHTRGLMAKDPTMDWSRRTVFYIPGWLDNMRSGIGPTLEFIYKMKGYNFWTLGAYEFMLRNFPQAARGMMAVGRYAGEMLANLTALQPRFDPKKLDLLGLSLGGHTMSFVAKSYKNITGIKVSRLTGMDPVGVCFRNRGPEGRIDDSDADFVDIIFTNMGNTGISSPIGHINYYVNGGENQPGDLYWMACGAVCSHGRSYALWIAALLYPNSFIAMKCDSPQDARDGNCYDRKPMVTNLLGINVDKNKTGIYYLATRHRFPYYMGENGLKKENNYVMKQLTKINEKDVLVF